MKHLILYLPAQISSKDDHRVTSIKEIISQPSCTCRGLFQIYLQICLLPIYKESFQWKNIRYGEGMYRRSLLLCVCVCVCVFSCSVESDSLQPHGLKPARLLSPWDSPGRNTGMGCHFLLQGIFLIQGSKLSLLHLLNWEMDSWALAPQYDLQQITEDF